ncbi:hypothetical protein [Candidatus Palauibacter sp.]|uniref:hypothetical protein n=1 Tax=Candidatus Palauibacter sp. TaxID=3101350 RepID=UPI003B5C1B4C
MSDDGSKWNWWLNLGAPVLVSVLAGIILLAVSFVSPAVRSFLGGVFGSIPATVYWVLGLCAAAAGGFVGGQKRERTRRRGKRVTKAEAEALVLESNYWSKLKRRGELIDIRNQVDFGPHGGPPEPEPIDFAIAALRAPRHWPEVDVLLQRFWDDNPKAASDGDSYHLDTLLDWLEEQAHEVELPNV